MELTTCFYHLLFLEVLLRKQPIINWKSLGQKGLTLAISFLSDTTPVLSSKENQGLFAALEV